MSGSAETPIPAAVAPSVDPTVPRVRANALLEATLRGPAILRFISDEDAEKLWPATRSYLLALMAGFGAEAKSR
jgi:hypothetical protein